MTRAEPPFTIDALERAADSDVWATWLSGGDAVARRSGVDQANATYALDRDRGELARLQRRARHQQQHAGHRQH